MRQCPVVKTKQDYIVLTTIVIGSSSDGTGLSHVWRCLAGLGQPVGDVFGRCIHAVEEIDKLIVQHTGAAAFKLDQVGLLLGIGRQVIEVTAGMGGPMNKGPFAIGDGDPVFGG